MYIKIKKTIGIILITAMMFTLSQTAADNHGVTVSAEVAAAPGIVFASEYPSAGKPFTVSVSGDSRDFTYEWKVGEKAVLGNTSDTYTPIEADLEKFIDIKAIPVSGTDEYTKRVYISARPVLYIDTDNGDAITSKTKYVGAYMKIQGNDEHNAQNSTLYDGRAELRVRGNYSAVWNENKPYKLKLGSKADVFGMGKNKHFTLLNNWIMSTTIRNTLSYTLSNMIIDTFTPKMVEVSVILNSDFRGSYTFSEQVRVGVERADVFDFENTGEDIADIISQAEGFSDEDWSALDLQMKTNLMWITDRKVTFKNITYDFKNYKDIVNYPDMSKQENFGGVLYERDGYEDEVTYFTTVGSKYTKVRKPKYLITNPVFFDNAKTLVNSFERALRSVDFYIMYDGKSVHYTELFDLNALVQYYMLNELTMNADFMGGSTFYYKPIGKPAIFGPPWDFDWVFGPHWDGRRVSPNSWAVYSLTPDYGSIQDNYFRSLMKDPLFLTRLFECYNKIRPTILQDLIKQDGIIDTTIEKLRGSAVASMDRWWESYNDCLWEYNRDASSVKTFLNNKVSWLDRQCKTFEGFLKSIKYTKSNRLEVTDINTKIKSGFTKITAQVTDISSATGVAFFINGINAGSAELKNGKAQIWIPDSMLETEKDVSNVVQIRGVAANGNYAAGAGREVYTSFTTFTKSVINNDTKGALINQVFGAGGKGDSVVSHNFIELYNPTNRIIDLKNYKIIYKNNGDGANGEINLDIVLLPGEKYFIKGKKESQTIASFPLINFTDNSTDCDLYIPNMVLGNKDCHIIFQNGDGDIIDEFGRGVLLTSVQEGAFAVASGNKHTIYSRTKDIDYDNASDFKIFNLNSSSDKVLASYKAAELFPSKSYDALNEPAKRTMRLIELIPEVVLIDDKAAIVSARASYNALSGEQKQKVTNYNKLKDAEADFIVIREKGDINGDGKINGMDLLLMKQHILDVAGKTLTQDTPDFDAADMNYDGVINGMDLLLLKKKILS